MIRVLGGPKRLCDGLTRRDLLHVGSLGMLGLSSGALGGSLRVDTDLSTLGRSSFGRAKSCILLFLYGSPSQIETFDPKPDAPVEVRGEFGCIPSSLPGLNVCERLPRLAQVMDKVTLIRSVTHPYPVHGVAYATTSNPIVPLAAELNPRDPLHWPYIGSVVDYIDGKRAASSGRPEVPRNLLLPWAFSSQRVGEVPRAGPYGGFLGPSYDPICTEFVGSGTRKATKSLLQMKWNDFELYRGITPESRFQLGEVSPADRAVTLDRLDRRRSLLEQVESQWRSADRAGNVGNDRYREMAIKLLSSERLRRAFELGEEDEATRDLYGMTLFGQAALTARRLVEAGGRFITVFWDEFGLAGTGWDTHWDHFPRMKDELLPGLDHSLSGLLLDLDRRGMLDETLVVLLSEHGRTPRIQSNVPGAGRDHWSRCYSVVMAGGGIARGRVIGRSDKIASDPAERPVSPKEILATIYHLMGIDPSGFITDRQGRPMAIVPGADPIAEAIG